ncbi:MAG: hypothetical protein WBF66_05850 [Dehalococcoidia bacterium]
MAQQQRQEPEQEPNPEDNFEVPEDTPTIYCDNMHINTGLWGSTLYVGEERPGQKPLLRAKVKVSPQMLRAISMLTGKHLRDYQQSIGPVPLPNALIHGWGIEEEIQ